MSYSAIDAFAGAGGLTLGLERAGFKTLASFDNDPLSVKTQRNNARYFDHRIIEASVDDMVHGGLSEAASIERGELFLLTGGPPCQGFSMQRIGGDSDERNNLVLEFVDLVEELMPRYFLMENVLGILGRRGKTLLRYAMSKAADAGYWVHHQALDVQDYGVPQRRKRVFVVGERNDGSLSSFTFPEPVTTACLRMTVRKTIGHLPPPPEDGSEHPYLPHHRKDRLSEINLQRLKALRPGEGREHLPDDLLADCHRRDASTIGHRNVYGRMAWDDVAPTITARFDSFTRGLFGHPEQLRSISLKEGALLQTFPEDFVFAGNKVDIARQIGNAVPPDMGRILGNQIIRCYEAAERLHPA